MYKVFIDNWPVFFIYEHENLTSVEIYATIHCNEQLDWDRLSKEHRKARKKNAVLLMIMPDTINHISDCFIGFKFIEAAGGVVRNSNREILVMERLGCWDLPKGKIDKGEDRATAALREVEEECGIHKHSIHSPLVTTYHTYKMKDKHHLKATYWYIMDYKGNESLVPQIEENITVVKWWNELEIDQIKRNTYLSIIEVLDEYQKKRP
jgi:8-oxo-dGTP pyrophosphatase MutT (NUDIX family)